MPGKEGSHPEEKGGDGVCWWAGQGSELGRGSSTSRRGRSLRSERKVCKRGEGKQEWEGVWRKKCRRARGVVQGLSTPEHGAGQTEPEEGAREGTGCREGGFTCVGRTDEVPAGDTPQGKQVKLRVSQQAAAPCWGRALRPGGGGAPGMQPSRETRGRNRSPVDYGDWRPETGREKKGGSKLGWVWGGGGGHIHNPG